jgi:hypothetical protein
LCSRLRFGRAKPKTHRYVIITDGLPPTRKRRRRASEFGKASVPNPGKNHSSTSVEPSRLQMILQRLRGDFYQVPPASEQIATSVMADLNDPEESSPALPH